MSKLPYRQVHLDFHTSGLLKNIGKEFSKEQFQQALKVGHVNSITVFSKCHHGYAYHPTDVHEMHPHLDFDLLQAQLDACKEIGVAAPVYISAGLDEKEAVRHPEWLVRNADESTTWAVDFTGTPNFHLLCYNTGYLELLLAQIEEVMQKYNPVGIFLDISGVHPCYCSKCRGEILASGKDPRDIKAVMALAEKVYKNYAQKCEALIHSYNKETRIFHNAGHIARGRRDLAQHNTHLELESLPTGGWGYNHFPLSAAYVSQIGMEYLGMTGKFHTMWGEFGGFKHPNALRYETALSIALGAKCSIGDQLHPLGEMDRATYELIGKAYSEVEQKEAWCDEAVNLADIAVLSEQAVNSEVAARETEDHADVGANRILLEGKYLYKIIDKEVDLTPFKLVILPDTIRLNEELARKLQAYIKNGGKILASGQSGLGETQDKFAIPLGVKYIEKNIFKPDYMRADFKLTNNGSAQIMYEQGYHVEVLDGQVIAKRENPYFNRDTYAFCSHQHTPNDPCPAGAGIVVTDQTAYIAWDIFTDYKAKGSLHLKEAVIYVIEHLIGKDKTLTTDFVDRGIVTLTEQKEQNRWINHLLYAHTTIRGQFQLAIMGGIIEVIEDIVPVYNVPVSVKVDKPVKRVYLAPQNEEIPFEVQDGKITYIVPKVEAHQMVVIEYPF